MCNLHKQNVTNNKVRNVMVLDFHYIICSFQPHSQSKLDQHFIATVLGILAPSEWSRPVSQSVHCWRSSLHLPCRRLMPSHRQQHLVSPQRALHLMQNHPPLLHRVCKRTRPSQQKMRTFYSVDPPSNTREGIAKYPKRVPYFQTKAAHSTPSIIRRIHS